MAPKQDNQPLMAFVLDFETGGLTPQTCAITQIAIHAVRLDNFEVVGKYARYVYPYAKKELKSATPKRKVLRSKWDDEAQGEQLMEYGQVALDYSAITMAMLYDKGEHIDKVAEGALRFISDMSTKVSKGSKPFIIGQNIEFDKGFLLQMLEYTGLVEQASKLLRGIKDFYGCWQPTVLDTIILGQLALCHKPEINSYKLELMCEHLGIDLDDAHDADADVTATANVVQVLSQRMRNSGGFADAEALTLNKAEKSRKHFKI
jgi:DNA polymerase III epsilon subunit-like protein